MNGGAAPSAWRFYRFALFVTGDGERDFLPSLFRPLERGGHCHFRVVHQIGQRRPIHSKARKQEMVGRGKLIPDKDEEISPVTSEQLDRLPPPVVDLSSRDVP
jgi:hypothetical protein